MTTEQSQEYAEQQQIKQRTKKAIEVRPWQAAAASPQPWNHH
jgi:hypothetical protein